MVWLVLYKYKFKIKSNYILIFPTLCRQTYGCAVSKIYLVFSECFLLFDNILLSILRKIYINFVLENAKKMYATTSSCQIYNSVKNFFERERLTELTAVSLCVRRVAVYFFVYSLVSTVYLLRADVRRTCVIFQSFLLYSV